MSLPPKKLSAAFVSSVLPKPRVKAYGDGRGGFGLTLHVHPTGVKSWQQHILINGRIRPTSASASIPPFHWPEARARALDNIRLVRRGGDPRRQRVSAAPTVMDTSWRRSSPATPPTWRNPERTARRTGATRSGSTRPILALRPVDEVTSAECTAVLGGASGTAPSRPPRPNSGDALTAVFKLVVAEGPPQPTTRSTRRTQRSPGGAGTRSAKRHHAAVPHGEVAAGLAAVDASGAWIGAKLGLRFLVFTAARSAEVRGATWDEIDLGRAVWTVPPPPHEGGRRTPRTARHGCTLDVLRDAARSAGSGPLLFPTVRGKQHAGQRSQQAAARRGRRWGPPTASDPRSGTGRRSARISRRAVIEAALAHRVADSVEAAYFRSDLFDRRRVPSCRHGRTTSRRPTRQPRVRAREAQRTADGPFRAARPA